MRRRGHGTGWSNQRLRRRCHGTGRRKQLSRRRRHGTVGQGCASALPNGARGSFQAACPPGRREYRWVMYCSRGYRSAPSVPARGGMGWDGMGRYGMTWHGMGWDEVGSYRIGWAGLTWAGLGAFEVGRGWKCGWLSPHVQVQHDCSFFFVYSDGATPLSPNASAVGCYCIKRYRHKDRVRIGLKGLHVLWCGCR